MAMFDDVIWDRNWRHRCTPITYQFHNDSDGTSHYSHAATGLTADSVPLVSLLLACACVSYNAALTGPVGRRGVCVCDKHVVCSVVCAQAGRGRGSASI
jgi:hypothetical protein